MLACLHTWYDLSVREGEKKDRQEETRQDEMREEDQISGT